MSIANDERLQAIHDSNRLHGFTPFLNNPYNLYVKAQYGYARKMTKGGNIEEVASHVNNPQDAAFLGGHALNQSYKVPAASPMGMENGSYVHPLGSKNAHRENAPTASKMIAPKMVGKNPAKNAGKGPIV